MGTEVRITVIEKILYSESFFSSEGYYGPPSGFYGVPYGDLSEQEGYTGYPVRGNRAPRGGRGRGGRGRRNTKTEKFVFLSMTYFYYEPASLQYGCECY